MCVGSSTTQNIDTNFDIYLIKTVDIFLNTIVEGVFLGQNSENIVSMLNLNYSISKALGAFR